MRLASFAVLLAVIAGSAAFAEPWPQWRGPQGIGLSEAQTAPLEWSREKNILWRTPLPGPGNSTPIVWGDRVFVTCASQNDTLRGLYCYNRLDGKELWKQVVEYSEKEVTHGTNPACSSSPTTDGQRVVAWHGSAGLFCYDLEGKELWKKDLGKFEHIWGLASSPVIYQDLVILHGGPGMNVFVAAFNKETGDEVWRQDFPGMKSEKVDEYRGSWSTPIVYRDGERDVLLLSVPEKLRALDPLTGEEIWSCGGLSKLVYTSPIYTGDIVIAMCGYGGPAIAVRAGGKGDITETHRLWLQEKNPQRIGSGVAIEGKIYIQNADGTLMIIDAETGNVDGRQRLGGDSWNSAVYAAGRIYFTNMNADVFVTEPGEKECTILAKNSLNELMRASPALSNGQIFLRTHEALYCVEEGK